MSQVQEAALELCSALHDWREKQGPKQLERLVVAANTLSGFALDLEAALGLVAQSSPAELCSCGSLLVRVPDDQTKNVPILTCSSCNGVFAFVRLNGGPHA